MVGRLRSWLVGGVGVILALVGCMMLLPLASAMAETAAPGWEIFGAFNPRIFHRMVRVRFTCMCITSVAFRTKGKDQRSVTFFRWALKLWKAKSPVVAQAQRP